MLTLVSILVSFYETVAAILAPDAKGCNLNRRLSPYMEVRSYGLYERIRTNNLLYMGVMVGGLTVV